MKALIVAKTRMKNACCVGAYSLDTKENLRLLTSTGDKLPEDIEYKIGDVWEIAFEKRSDIVKPHVEDVLVHSKTFIRRQENLASFLKNTVPIWKESPANVFEGKANFPLGQSGYIDRKRGMPTQSVGFWVPDQDLELTIFADRRHYYYFGTEQVYVFPYVGYVPVVEKIPKGTLIRISLARWWSPYASGQETRSYCQMSGWYTDY